MVCGRSVFKVTSNRIGADLFMLLVFLCPFPTLGDRRPCCIDCVHWGVLAILILDCFVVCYWETDIGWHGYQDDEASRVYDLNRGKTWTRSLSWSVTCNRINPILYPVVATMRLVAPNQASMTLESFSLTLVGALEPVIELPWIDSSPSS